MFHSKKLKTSTISFSMVTGGGREDRGPSAGSMYEGGQMGNQGQHVCDGSFSRTHVIVSLVCCRMSHRELRLVDVCVVTLQMRMQAEQIPVEIAGLERSLSLWDCNTLPLGVVSWYKGGLLFINIFDLYRTDVSLNIQCCN